MPPGSRIAASAPITTTHGHIPVAVAAVSIILQHCDFVDVFDSIGQLVDGFQVTRRHFAFLADFFKFVAQHVFQCVKCFFAHDDLLSAHALDHKVCVRKQNGLCACIFGGNGQAAATRDFHKRRHVNIKIVFYCCRCHGRSCAAQRLSVDSKRRSNSFHCAASRDSNVCPEAHFKTSFTLVRKPSQGYNSCTFTVHNAAITRYRRFSQRHVLTSSDRNDTAVRILSHSIFSFLMEKTGGEAFAPPPYSCKISYRAEQNPLWIQLLFGF
nr:MAG TPA: hypothetical protein [Caudoviricetes sp.]